MWWKGLTKVVQERTFILLVFNVLFLVSSGAAVLFVFERTLFVELDWVKVLFLAVAITAPLTFWNMLVTSAWDGFNEGKEAHYASFTMGNVLTTFVLYCSLAICYYASAKGWATFLGTVIVFEMFITIPTAIWDTIRTFKSKYARR